MHAEAWALTTAYRDRPEWNHFLRDCALFNSCTMAFNLNNVFNTDSMIQQKKLHFQDYLIKVKREKFIWFYSKFHTNPFIQIFSLCREYVDINY